MSSPPDGSQLCLACGVCCQGILHREAHVENEEASAVRKLGLAVVGCEGNLTFSLPCPLHRENRCTVYADRPSTCSTYRCKLLKRYTEGSATWEECIRYVSLLKELVGRIRQGLGLASPSHNFWQEVRSFESSELAGLLEQRDLLMDVVSFLTLSRRHFQNRSSPVEVLGP